MSSKLEATFGPGRTYPGTLAQLLPKPPRPNDAWAKDEQPVWAGDLAKQRRTRK